MANIKSWKSMAEQLALLKSRGLLVDNETMEFVKIGSNGYCRGRNEN